MSIILLHNGNSKVKTWASQFYKCDVYPCINDPWQGHETVNDKLTLAKTKTICTDLSGADSVDPEFIFQSKSSFEYIKILTSFQNDVDNLEPVWQKYNNLQWMQSSFLRLSVADKIIFLNPISLPSLSSLDPVVFTPGRSGTHVVKDITGVNDHLHHNGNLLASPNFSRLVNSNRIISILRESFVDQAISDLISRRYGFLLTTSENLERAKQQVNQWDKIEFKYQDAVDTLNKLLSYTDLLLGLRMFYNKQIEFSILENLHEYFDQIKHIKNPYHHGDMISNYEHAVELCDTLFQPMYDQILKKIQNQLGTSIYQV